MANVVIMHTSDCSTNNRGVPELLGPCDCGHELKVRHKYASYLYRLSCNQVWRWRTRFLSHVGWRFLKPRTSPSPSGWGVDDTTD